MSSESTTFIVDVSPSMIKNDNVFKSMAYLEYTLLNKSKKSRKTDWISCYLANCPISENSQEIPNVFQIQSFLAPVTTTDTIKFIRHLKQYCEQHARDSPTEDFQSMIQCLLVASLDIKQKFQARKILKQIVVFTDNLDELDITDEEINVLVEELNARIVLIDCRKDSQDDRKQSNWLKLVEAIPDSKVYTINELLIEITSPATSIVKPVRIFSGELRLGADILTTQTSNPKGSVEDANCLCFRVEAFPATKAISGLNRKTVIQTEDSNKQVKYLGVKSIIEYEIHNEENNKSAIANDEAEPSYTSAIISKDSVTKAYRYGADYVVLPSVLVEQTVYETFPGMDLRGFLDREALPRYYLTSESSFIVADTRLGCLSDAMAFSALVDVMLENRKVAVARYVSRKDSEVTMCALCPVLIEQEDNERKVVRSLISCRLPFAEDERVTDFPKLLNRTTTSGVPLKNETDEDQIDDLMGQFVESMDTDELPEIPSYNYYQSINNVTTDTTLPLPALKKGQDANKDDPLRIPTVFIYRQQQVLLEWIHQLMINDSKEFQIPELPDSLREKISPYTHKKFDSKELAKILRIKKSDKPNLTSDLKDQLEREKIPDLETLLKRGEQDNKER
ncbi:hypothetical protein SEUBUCD646_0M02420 [Saccharomyces eubayanus]|uniref:ATP-dependent DNA helicase II subunit 2 n=1 Tax=Saccharomyces eubayanus TaxID=1080349 RepID=A0ABN8VIC9_SACEU|nr:hypothetical protein SEUBUCD650_0M02400 [Saccharomyces eubayanus]CAI1664791.1 hypothetical protein SEUBUCD646_0M02420 [Saccharomyces eubayanus]